MGFRPFTRLLKYVFGANKRLWLRISNVSVYWRCFYDILCVRCRVLCLL